MHPVTRLLAAPLAAAALLNAGSAITVAAEQPNIVYLLADDLGYGDLQGLNPEGKIATPNYDRLAREGMVFTDAHSGSAVCTPTRYGILTGRYCFRSPMKKGVLGGFSPPLIPPSRMTVASFLNGHGYRTACIGKWHLGLDWTERAEPAAAPLKGEGWKIDYAAPVRGGPTALGFDEFFGISASLDMPPYVYIENDRCTAVPTVEKAFHRKGPAAEDFEAVNVLPDLTRRAVDFLDRRAKEPATPFFLYLPFNSPHTPIVPGPAFKGRSGINAYADFVMQTDACVGEVMAALERNGQAGNTLLIVTSDNGCSPQANFQQLATHGHNPSYRFRGHKADIFEGGHRIPFIAHWPGKVKAGSAYAHPVCLTDLLATCAEIVGAPLPETAGEDSISILPALLAKTTAPVREAVVHHSINGSFAIRQGRWKLELCPDSGGWSDPRPGKAPKDAPPVQLYDLESDLGETRNVVEDHPEVAMRLIALLERYARDGRSTPGAPQPNDGEVDSWNGRPPWKPAAR